MHSSWHTCLQTNTWTQVLWNTGAEYKLSRGNKRRRSEKINLSPTLPKEHKSSFVVPVYLTQKWPKQYFPSYIQVSFESRFSVHLMPSGNLWLPEVCRLQKYLNEINKSRRNTCMLNWLSKNGPIIKNSTKQVYVKCRAMRSVNHYVLHDFPKSPITGISALKFTFNTGILPQKSRASCCKKCIKCWMSAL